MATVTWFTDRQQPKDDSSGGYIVAQAVLNFALNNVTAADVVKALIIPAGVKVTKTEITILTAEGATCTATFGDTTTADGWDASVNLNAASGTSTVSLEATDTYGVGKYYSTETALSLTMGHDTDTAKINVTAFGYRLQTT